MTGGIVSLTSRITNKQLWQKESVFEIYLKAKKRLNLFILRGGAKDHFQVTLDWAKDKDSIKPEDEAKQLPILQIQNPNGRRASSGEFEI